MKRYWWLVGLAIAVVPGLCFGRTEYAPKIWVMKTDSLGDTLWTKYYEGRLPFMFGANCVQQTSDGGLIITGAISYGRIRLYLLKLDSNFDSAWSGVYDWNLEGQTVIETPDKGFLVLAQLFSSFISYADISNGIQIMKTDSLGNILWIHTEGKELKYRSSSLRILVDGNYLLTGDAYSPEDSSTYIWLLKLDSLGETLWIRTYEGNSSYSVNEAADGGFIISTGRFVLKVDSAGNKLWDIQGKTDAMISSINTQGDNLMIAECDNGDSLRLVQIDEEGQLLWEYPDGYGKVAFGIYLFHDGGYIVTGLKVRQRDRVPFLLKTTQKGEIVWEREYLPDARGLGRWVTQTPDGGYIVVGSQY